MFKGLLMIGISDLKNGGYFLIDLLMRGSYMVEDSTGAVARIANAAFQQVEITETLCASIRKVGCQRGF